MGLLPGCAGEEGVGGRKREDLTSLLFEMRKIAHVLSLLSVLFVHSNVLSVFLNELFQSSQLSFEASTIHIPIL